jgi:hypothetical protein
VEYQNVFELNCDTFFRFFGEIIGYDDVLTIAFFFFFYL